MPSYVGVAWEFDTIDGEHLAANESLSVAEVEDLGRELGHVISKPRDEGSDGREVRGTVAGEGDEADVFAAQPFDSSAADDAFSVGTEVILSSIPGG